MQASTFFAAAMVAFALSGCVENMEMTGPPLKVAPEASARDRTVGANDFTVRTYTMSDKTRNEVSGAACRVRSSSINLSLQTPRQLSLPIYAQGERFKNRGAPSPLTVTCKAGDLSGTVTVMPAPVGTTNAVQSSTGYSGNTNQITVHTVTLTGRMSSAYPWSYGPGVAVILN